MVVKRKQVIRPHHVIEVSGQFRHATSRDDELSPFLYQVPQIHNDIELVFLESGCYSQRIGGVEFTVPCGQLMLFWAMMPHQIIHCDKGTCLNWYHLPIPWFLNWRLPGLLSHHLLQGNVVITSVSEGQSRLDRDIFRRWHQELKIGSPLQREIVLEELQLRLKRLSISSTVTDPAHGRGKMAEEGITSLVVRMAQYIAEHFTDPELCISEIASAASIHPDSAIRLFRKTLAMTINDYLARHRIALAQHMLSHSNCKVIQVAMDCGFGSMSQFHRVFRKFCGMTPASYRMKSA